MSKKYAKFKRRPEHIEQKIVEKLSNTKTLYNILDKQDILGLLKIFQKAKKSNSDDSSQQLIDDLLDNEDLFESTNLKSKPTDTIQCTASLNWNQGVSEILEKKLRKHIEDFEIVGGQFYLNNGSFKLHTDSGADPNSVIYKLFTIPLKFKTDMTIYTPVFNQYWLGSAARFERNATVIQNNTHQNITNYASNPIFNLTHQNFPLKDYKNLSHINYQTLWGFSLESKNKWNLGDIFIIDRAKVHTSCDFSKEQNASKFFMTIVTTLKH